MNEFSKINNIRVKDEYAREKINEIIEEMHYVPPKITSFTANKPAGNYEVGDIITSPTFTWVIDEYRKLEFQTITDINDISSTTRSATYDGNITSNKTFTLRVSDGKTIVESSLTYSFKNYKFWGASTIPSEYNSDWIKGLTNKAFSTNNSGSITTTAGADEYIYYCIPSGWGVPAFNVAGFDGGFSKVKTLTFVNYHNTIVLYDIYKSDNPNLGKTTVSIK